MASLRVESLGRIALRSASRDNTLRLSPRLLGGARHATTATPAPSLQKAPPPPAPIHNPAAPRQPPVPMSRTVTPSAPAKANIPATNTYSFESQGLSDDLPLDIAPPDPSAVNWSTSFSGLSSQPFEPKIADVLLAPLDPNDVELKPDGIIYLPEIKYRRILNKAFGPGGWGLAPRSETIITSKTEGGGQGLVTREYALVAHGRLMSVARGEQDYFSSEGIPTATEGCKSNALMRCCKDLGIASELWDPRFIQKWIKEWGREVWVENVVTKKKRKIWRRKDDQVKGSFKEV